MDHYSKAHIIFSKIKGFYNTHGEIATKEAFGVDRKVISRWKKRLTGSGGKLVSLVP